MKLSRRIKDLTATRLMIGITLLAISLMVVIGLVLAFRSEQILSNHSMWSLLGSSVWKPMKGEFGFLAFIAGTLAVTALAITLALPAALLASIWMSEYAGESIRRGFAPVIDLLAGIPPVVYGVWGTLTIVPLIAETAPHFVDFSTGYSLLAGGIVLAVMVLPLMMGLFGELFATIPRDLREASLALGATRWETSRKVIVRKALPGIVATTVLAVSRAFGETIAVMMVCGNVVGMPHSLFDPVYPLPALIANNYGEMMSLPDYESALMLAALLLFVIIVAFNMVSHAILHRLKQRIV